MITDERNYEQEDHNLKQDNQDDQSYVDLYQQKNTEDEENLLKKMENSEVTENENLDIEFEKALDLDEDEEDSDDDSKENEEDENYDQEEIKEPETFSDDGYKID